MKYRISLIILLLLSSFALNALTLEEAVNYASENSVPVKISYENTIISGLEKKQAISNFLPLLTLNTTYTKLDEVPTMTIAGPMGTPMVIPLGIEDNYAASFELGIPIFMGGKLITGYSIAKEKEIISKLELEKSRADIKMAVIQMYISGLLLDEMINMTNVLYNSKKEHYESALSKYTLGSTSKIELLSAEMQLKSIEPKIAEMNNQRKSIINSMKLIIGLSLDEDFEIEGSLKNILDSVLSANPLDKNDLTEEGLNNSKELNILDKSVSILGKVYRLTKLNFLPNIVGYANYKYNNVASATNDSLMLFNDTLFMDGSLVWGIRISFDLFSGGRKVLDVLKTGHQYKQLNMIYANKIEQIEIDIENISNNYAISKMNTETYKYTLSLAEEAFSIAQEQYDQGIISNSDYIDAETNYIQARAGYSQNLFNQIVNYYSLLNALGIL